MRMFGLALLVAFGLSSAAYAQGAGYQMNDGQEQGGRSGFWTSRAPAKGGAYRWRLLGIGVVLASLTGAGILVLIRRANHEREKSQ